MNLSLLILLPAITSLIILFSGKEQAKRIALGGALIQLGLTIFLLMCFWADSNLPGATQFIYEYNASWFPALQINYHVGVDGISVAMILLTAFVVFAGILMSWKVDRMQKEFFFLLTILGAGAYGFFISLDLFLMFFFLEVAVIPKFMLIGIWGSGKKIYSANKLALMLMAGSALVLIGMFGVYFLSNIGTASFDLVQISANGIPKDVQLYFFPFLFVGFGVFTALFPFHTWVPDGHSSAPTAASMFLAGISMKLGGYGCLRVATYLMPEAAEHYSWIIILLATIAIIYGAFATMMQTDLKYMNAYSSVSHCGFVLLGIGMLTPTAVTGAVLQMVSHGLMTALFFAAIGMLYERTHTREVAKLGGLLKVMPFISTVFFIAGLCSLGLPGLSGFVAEMTVFVGSWERVELLYRLATILACMSIVVTAVYILRATGKAMMGPVLNPEFNKLKDAAWNERLAGVVLIAGILAMGVMPFWLKDLVSPGALNIIEQINGVALLK
ncbi:MAG TPA: NADH-quinone oxidoreductase subunit M [Bacteroidia bacterium]|nr:NADH-quinone oxidoreductase subunit M [Bacteroidia bacterium]